VKQVSDIDPQAVFDALGGAQHLRDSPYVVNVSLCGREISGDQFYAEADPKKPSGSSIAEKYGLVCSACRNKETQLRAHTERFEGRD